MSKPKLYYYRVLGRAQFIVALLNYLNVDFEFIQFSGCIPDEIKRETTFESVPLYVDSDVKMCQTFAIVRYLSEKHSFLGKDIIERSKTNEIVDSYFDCLGPVFRFAYYSGDRNNIKVDQYLKVYENLLNVNKFISGGNDYTLADLGTYVVFKYLKHMGLIDKSYPKLEQLKSHFDSLPQMKSFLEMYDSKPK